MEQYRHSGEVSDLVLGDQGYNDDDGDDSEMIEEPYSNLGVEDIRGEDEDHDPMLEMT